MSNIINGFTPLKTSDFTWYNQRSATSTDSAGGINLYAPDYTPDQGYTFTSLYKTAPSTPYKVIANMQYTYTWQAYVCWGLCWVENGGKSINFMNMTRDTNKGIGRIACHYNSAPGTADQRWDYTGDYYPDIRWFQLEDDGTNRNMYISLDGVNWTLMKSESRTNYCTPNQVGICFSPYNQIIYLSVNSFKIIYTG